MQTTTAKLYSLEYNNARTYVFSALFIAGNILLPQLCHTIHLGGPMLLPIYFFTLIGAYKYGWRVGLLTAVLSPLINSMLFGMPLPEVLPAILQIDIVGHSRRICRISIRESLSTHLNGSRTLLSSSREPCRMGYCK